MTTPDPTSVAAEEALPSLPSYDYDPRMALPHRWFSVEHRGHPGETCYGPDQRTFEATLAAARSRPAGELDVERLRSPRNSLGKPALPKGLMEQAVEAAWEGSVSAVGDPADGIEMHDLADLADGICDFLALASSTTTEAGEPEQAVAYRLSALLEELVLAGGLDDPFDARDRAALARLGYVRAAIRPVEQEGTR